MNPVLVTLVLALLTAVLFLALRRRPAGPHVEIEVEVPEKRQPCPLCGSSLKPGERVHSIVFSTKTQDKIMEISGCPYCRPPGNVDRYCPVCKKTLRPQDIVTARVFERVGPQGVRKTHVHVLGCPRCRA